MNVGDKVYLQGTIIKRTYDNYNGVYLVGIKLDNMKSGEPGFVEVLEDFAKTKNETVLDIFSSATDRELLLYSLYEQSFAPNKDHPGSSNTEQHKRICSELNDLYARKNADYGDSFHKSYEDWGLIMAAVRLSDKFNRFGNLIKREEQNVKDESLRDTLIDLANYAIMTVMELDREKETST